MWGIFVFDEQIHSRSKACLAIFLMMVGLLGMSYYSSPVANHPPDHHPVDVMMMDNGDGTSSVVYQEVVESRSSDDEDNFGDERLGAVNALQTPSPEIASLQNTKTVLTDRTSRTTYSDSVPSVVDPEEGDAASLHPHDAASSASISIQSSHVITWCGVVINKRRLGMLAAMFCGVWGGSIMAPMKYSPADTKGVGYLISFAIGASIVTLALWAARFLYYCQKYESAAAAYRHLPSFHFRTMWLAGGTCGLLWSIGNFFSLFSVYYLGEGVGYPLVQTSILISGLWGIFYFKEVQGFVPITKWLLSSLCTIAGIILLSYEHHEK